MLWGFPTFQTRSLDPLWWMKILKQNHSFQALIYLVHLIFLEYSAKIIYLINTSWCIDRMITFFLIFIFTLFYFTILYWFCHTLTWIHHRYTWVPNPEPPPPHIISLDHPRAPAPSILYPVSNIDWHFISYMIVYMNVKF